MKKYLLAFTSIHKNTLLSFVLITSFSTLAFGQGDGARFYWKGLAGTNAVPLITSSLSGNANPLDPTHHVQPGANFDATMSMVGYAKMLPLFNRSALVSIIQPMGRVTATTTAGALSSTMAARGYGDPMLLLDINVFGPKAIMNIPDYIRYQPGFSVDIMGSLAFPIGEYDNESPLNIGQNRWYGRIGAPIVWSIGSWAANKRTTIECLPAVWFFGNNSDFMGQTMQTEPMYQVEGHVTHNFMEHFWGSLDVISYSGGKATIGGVEGSSLSNLGVGGTLGYDINENMQLNASYSSSVNDSAPEDLKMDGFRVTLIYGWHKLVEGSKRLKGE